LQRCKFAQVYASLCKFASLRKFAAALQTQACTRLVSSLKAPGFKLESAWFGFNP
jgi:hypothetical protein